MGPLVFAFARRAVGNRMAEVERVGPVPSKHDQVRDWPASANQSAREPLVDAGQESDAAAGFLRSLMLASRRPPLD